MLLYSVLALLTLLAALLVWRSCRVPIRGDVQIQLLWRGALAGLAGEVMGVALSSLLWRPRAYWYLGYVYWLLVSLVLGLAFTFAAWGVQKMTSRLNVLARAAVGGVIGGVAAWGWASWVSATRFYQDTSTNDFGKSLITMIVATGVMAGLLAVPPEGDKR